MPSLGLEKHIVNEAVYANTVKSLKAAGVIMPTFAELADPKKIPAKIQKALEKIDPDSPNPLNLFRVHWYNDADRKGQTDVPAYIVLPEALTGVKAKILVAVADRFTMIKAHKVLAAYACLAPRLVTGQFDPTHHRAIWPSTGNYCRGGVAISRILGCRGVAILPQEMSEERFAWLRQWVVNKDEDVIATPGCESNVKEIYDKCNELNADEQNIIFNQFCEFGNHLAHFAVTGKALGHIFTAFTKGNSNARLRAFVSATGSAGTIAAGDYLKETYGSKTVAVEAQECPTLLYNGFGGHNIQGIGDKHVPYIHNAYYTDELVGISDVDTDCLNVLFNSDAGKQYLIERKGLSADFVSNLKHFGLSGICNILAAIKCAKYHKMGENDVIVTVATDSAAMYVTEAQKTVDSKFGGKFDLINAGEVFGRSLAGMSIDHLEELDQHGKDRIFNLGYFTWVEQQGVEFKDFVARRNQSYWTKMRELLPAWDEMITNLNKATGVLENL